jgi:hypothetical protein
MPSCKRSGACWAVGLADAFSRVELGLRKRMAAAHDPDGLFAEVDDTRPTLARQADKLRGSHSELLSQAMSLRAEARHAADFFSPSGRKRAETSVARGRRRIGTAADVHEIRQRAEQFLVSLQKHEEAEIRLVQESINTDIGVGD